MIIAGTINKPPIIPIIITVAIVGAKVVNVLLMYYGLYYSKVEEREQQEVPRTEGAETYVNIIKALIKHYYGTMFMSNSLKEVGNAFWHSFP